MMKFIEDRDRIPYTAQGLLSRPLLQYFGIPKDNAVGLCQKEQDKRTQRIISQLRWDTMQDPQRGIYVKHLTALELVRRMADKCARDGSDLIALHVAE